MTNKPLPVRHSPYVSGVLRPLKVHNIIPSVSPGCILPSMSFQWLFLAGNTWLVMYVKFYAATSINNLWYLVSQLSSCRGWLCMWMMNIWHAFLVWVISIINLLLVSHIPCNCFCYYSHWYSIPKHVMCIGLSLEDQI